MLSKKLIVIFVCLFIFCMLLYLWSETTLFYSQPSINPIKTYSRVQVEEIPITFPNETHLPMKTYGFKPIEYTITDMKFTINNALSTSDVSMQIQCINLTRNVNFWDSIVTGLLELNATRLNEYKKANPPDLRIECPCFVNGSSSFWIQVLDQAIPSNSISLNEPFLRQTSFNTYECNFLFDNNLQTIDINNDTFFSTPLHQISFDVKVPNNYAIQDIEKYDVSKNAESFTTLSEIHSGDTFHLIITDKNLEPIKSVISAFSYIGFASTILGIIISEIIERRKK